MARPMPVLPLVASTTVWPGLSAPDFSAASMTPRASRSLTDPSGLNASTLANRFTPVGPRRLMRTTGVRPTVSRMFWYLAMGPSLFRLLVWSGIGVGGRQLHPGFRQSPQRSLTTGFWERCDRVHRRAVLD